MGDICALIEKYKSAYPEGKYLLDEPMKNHTTFRIGGQVKALFQPSSVDEVAFIAKLLHNENEKTLIMGNGSDLLVSDRPLDMAVIKLGENFNSVTAEGTSVTALSGALLPRVAAFARDNGLTGLEFAGGIPSSVGGAVFMNAGAYGGEISAVLDSVTVLDEGLNIKTYSCRECEYGYRDSIFMHEPHKNDIVLSAAFTLSRGDKAEITARMDELSVKRKTKQPLEFPSAGSTFKRPEGHFAGALIEQAGLKGLTVGGAQVSEKHAGFVINIGNATFDDVVTLMDKVKEEVFRKFGVELEPEVRIIR